MLMVVDMDDKAIGALLIVFGLTALSFAIVNDQFLTILKYIGKMVISHKAGLP